MMSDLRASLDYIKEEALRALILKEHTLKSSLYYDYSLIQSYCFWSLRNPSQSLVGRYIFPPILTLVWMYSLLYCFPVLLVSVTWEEMGGKIVNLPFLTRIA